MNGIFASNSARRKRITAGQPLLLRAGLAQQYVLLTEAAQDIDRRPVANAQMPAHVVGRPDRTTRRAGQPYRFPFRAGIAEGGTRRLPLDIVPAPSAAASRRDPAAGPRRRRRTRSPGIPSRSEAFPGSFPEANRKRAGRSSSPRIGGKRCRIRGTVFSCRCCSVSVL